MPIEGGYIKVARKIWDSEIATKPPHYLNIWLWLVSEATHKERHIRGKKLKRGQLITTYDTIIQQHRSISGNRQKLLKKHHVETVIKYLSKAGMIETRKTTRGMIVTISNYEDYQNATNYENHTGTDTETVSKTTANRQDKQELKNERSFLEKSDNEIEEIKKIFKGKAEDLKMRLKNGDADEFISYYRTNDWKYKSKKVNDWGAASEWWLLKKKKENGTKTLSLPKQYQKPAAAQKSK